MSAVSASAKLSDRNSSGCPLSFSDNFFCLLGDVADIVLKYSAWMSVRCPQRILAENSCNGGHLGYGTAGTHGSICDKPLALNRTKQNGCLLEYEVRCSNCSFSSVWISSPVLPDGRDLVNLRITHGYLSSGLLPSQLDRFLKATTLDTVPTPRMTQNVNQYAKCVEEERTASCTTALQSECASANENGIDIITDARLSTRRKYTDVVCI